MSREVLGVSNVSEIEKSVFVYGRAHRVMKRKSYQNEQRSGVNGFVSQLGSQGRTNSRVWTCIRPEQAGIMQVAMLITGLSASYCRVVLSMMSIVGGMILICCFSDPWASFASSLVHIEIRKLVASYTIVSL